MDNKIDLVAIKEERDLMLRTGLSIADKFINKISNRFVRFRSDGTSRL